MVIVFWVALGLHPGPRICKATVLPLSYVPSVEVEFLTQSTVLACIIISFGLGSGFQTTIT